ncbi:major facilitator superfamily domain-containing protein [Cladorrhinum sp. PSN259]|nr:major facilitator superfamily domain-containing protein [Cladorrhinum sp. PSN259]
MNGGERHDVIPKWSFGILKPKDTTQVPGSILLLVDDHTIDSGHEKTRETLAPKMTIDGRIILEPQPDDSPNDPLNWPRWRRDIALVSLGLYCMLGGGITPLLAVGFTEISKDYDIPITDVSLTTGLIILGLGVGCVLINPKAIIYGKRPVYLGSAALFLLTAVWCAPSPSFSSLLVARVVQGIAVSPVEALLSASIAETFFLHERAFRIGIYALMLLGGKNLVPLVSAAIINSLGWRWAFWIMAMAIGFVGSLLFFFSHEIFWYRNVAKNTPSPISNANLPPKMTSRGLPGPKLEEGEIRAEGIVKKMPEEPTELFDLTEPTLPAVAIMFQEAEKASPYFPGLANSGFLDSEKVQSEQTPLAKTTANRYTERLRSYPPAPFTYHFTALQTGLVYISPFVGGVLGSAVAGQLSDWTVRAMARRNDGVYEPEFRLVMAAPEKDLWIVPTVFLGIISFGYNTVNIGSTTAIAFCVDSYRQFAGEALVTLNFSIHLDWCHSADGAPLHSPDVHVR